MASDDEELNQLDQDEKLAFQQVSNACI